MNPKEETVEVSAVPQNGSRRNALVRAMSDGRDVSVTEHHGQLDGQAIMAAINGTKADLGDIVKDLAESTRQTEADYGCVAEETVTPTSYTRKIEIRCRKDKS